MRVNGETMIFRNEREGKDGKFYTYATGVSSKKQDGTYVNGYLDVRFKKGVVVENKTKIDIKDGFLTVREFIAGNDIKKKIELMVLDFDTVSQSNDTGFSALNYDDVPF